MGALVDRDEIEEAGAPLEGVEGAEDGIERLAVPGILLQGEDAVLDVEEMLLGLGDELAEELAVGLGVEDQRDLALRGGRGADGGNDAGGGLDGSLAGGEGMDRLRRLGAGEGEGGVLAEGAQLPDEAAEGGELLGAPGGEAFQHLLDEFGGEIGRLMEMGQGGIAARFVAEFGDEVAEGELAVVGTGLGQRQLGGDFLHRLVDAGQVGGRRGEGPFRIGAEGAELVEKVADLGEVGFAPGAEAVEHPLDRAGGLGGAKVDRLKGRDVGGDVAQGGEEIAQGELPVVASRLQEGKFPFRFLEQAVDFGVVDSSRGGGFNDLAFHIYQTGTPPVATSPVTIGRSKSSSPRLVSR